MTATVERVPLGTPIGDAWAGLAFRGYTACATCGALGNCRGVNPASRVCVTCLEFEHGCKAPNMRRRKK